MLNNKKNKNHWKNYYNIYKKCVNIYLIYIEKMTNNENIDNTENDRMDRILLVLRRLFVILFVFLILWIVLFKILKINKKVIVDTTTNTWSLNENVVEIDKNEKDLWNNYINDWKNVLYKGNIVKFADLKNFKIINKKDIDGKIINSNNLLKIFANYETRVNLMQNIDSIINKKENITNELKNSSENGMYKMKNDYKELSQFNRNDRYDMTDEQRAKFAIMFLYIKIIKKQSNDKVSMNKALSELKIFLENFDKDNLTKEVEDKDISRIKWDIWIDDDCLYVNGELYACFLDGLFVK